MPNIKASIIGQRKKVGTPRLRALPMVMTVTILLSAVKCDLARRRDWPTIAHSQLRFDF